MLLVLAVIPLRLMGLLVVMVGPAAATVDDAAAVLLVLAGVAAAVRAEGDGVVAATPAAPVVSGVRTAEKVAMSSRMATIESQSP